ncbi:MAG: hypothetical protein Q7T16_06135 [Candidatus Burarchaeum sp.]|nr:hypothetical protein [Candidatus Burarchaeum sp.]MDO8340207.1 hypothetical protein [Candidatus Burarchaeum sp.]
MAFSESTSLRELARIFGMSHMSVWRALRSVKPEDPGDWDDGT